MRDLDTQTEQNRMHDVNRFKSCSQNAQVDFLAGPEIHVEDEIIHVLVNR